MRESPKRFASYLISSCENARTRRQVNARSPRPTAPRVAAAARRASRRIARSTQPRDRCAVPVERVPLGVRRLVRPAEAEVVGRDHPRHRSEWRNQLPVEVRPRRLAVQEQGRVAGALVDVVHAEPVLLHVARRELVTREPLEPLVGRAVDVHAAIMADEPPLRRLEERSSVASVFFDELSDSYRRNPRGCR